MYCSECGKSVEKIWKKCPYCGYDLTSSGIDNGEKDTRQNHKINSGKKRGWIVGGIAAVIVMVCIGVMNLGNNTDDALAVVQDGHYGKYDTVTVKEVLEYNWNNGEWDAFTADDADQSMIVEYAKDAERNTLLQFKVDRQNENFDLVYFEIDGNALADKAAGAEALMDLYYSYFNAKFPLREIDFAEYVSKDIDELLSSSTAFYETEKGLSVYEDVSKQVIITLDEESISSVNITGNGVYTPQFAGISVGDNSEFANVDELVKYGYVSVVYEDDNSVVIGNPENNSTIFLQTNGNGVITSITWTADVFDDMEAETPEVIPTETFVPDISVDYDYIYGRVLDSVWSGYTYAGEYYLEYAYYDIDKDGYSECIILHGTCFSDMIYEVYTTDGDSAISVGTMPGGGESIYQCPETNGVYRYFANGGYEILTHVHIHLGQLVEEILFEGETEEYGNFAELELPIEMIVLN